MGFNLMIAFGWLCLCSIESKYNMKELLMSLGLTDIFDSGKANFTGISKEQLYVSDVVQVWPEVCFLLAPLEHMEGC